MPPLGEYLKERRQEHQWTLEEAARQTRIPKQYLEALELGDYELIPADVQARGFVRTYASVLGVDPDEAISLYQQDRGKPELVSVTPLTRPQRARSCALPSLGFALFAFLIVAAVALWLDRGWLNPTTTPPTATAPPPTPTDILPTATPTVRVLRDTPTRAPSPEQTQTYEGLEAVLEVSAACWVRVVADGVDIYQGTLRAGTTHTYTAMEELRIRMGNGGGISVTLNGEDLGVQGAPGQVVDRTWRADE